MTGGHNLSRALPENFAVLDVAPEVEKSSLMKPCVVRRCDLGNRTRGIHAAVQLYCSFRYSTHLIHTLRKSAWYDASKKNELTDDDWRLADWLGCLFICCFFGAGDEGARCFLVPSFATLFPTRTFAVCTMVTPLSLSYKYPVYRRVACH